MSELINRQKLSEELNMTTEYGFYGEFMDGSEVAYTLRELMQIIESQPPADQWIPCSERLPRAYHDVVVCHGGTLVEQAMMLPDGRWQCAYTTYDSKSVKAWMPLPEPYKGEK